MSKRFKVIDNNIVDTLDELPPLVLSCRDYADEWCTFINDTLFYKNYYKEQESKLRKRLESVLTENWNLNITMDVLCEKLFKLNNL